MTSFVKQKYKNCSNDVSLITVVFDRYKQKYLLEVETEAYFSKYQTNKTPILSPIARLEEFEDQLKCCYKQIKRSGKGRKADKTYNLLPCTHFHQYFVVPDHIEYMIVECSLNSTIIQKDAFSFIQYRKLPSTVKADRPANNTRKPSVYLIGIDSLSSINFRRNMPLTFNYFQENNWFELQGTNKIGDNTFPNLMAVMAGMDERTTFEQCDPTSVGGLDKCNIIWNDFKKYGYRTAFAEDEVTMSTFNYGRYGFEKVPTDHYLRPMLLAISNKLNVTDLYGLFYCVGRNQYAAYIYDYMMQLANRYQEEPTFGLFWTNSISHNAFDASSIMDGKMLEYFKTMKANGILENAIVFFLSDHGMRWGSLLRKPNGFLENRLPMFFISLPKWFKNRHPDIVKALQVNRHRLTSSYDIYMTMKHILELSEPGIKLPAAQNCPKCQSVFKEVPENRTCADAGITEHWCTCTLYDIVPTDNSIIKNITNQIINSMNEYLEMKNISSICSKIELRDINSALIKIEENDEINSQPTYRVEYSVNPKSAIYEASVVYDSLKKTIKINVEDISCLTSYAKIANCVQDKQAKKYCICKI
ncbi:uncharacterized protein LOC119682309 [Teleopsis dalmanni]|uniref:uncharacterized protein LOC119682309 n=1 Tax=Teleopsis dalmanni TaxID=139649 RepID=UPI0018CCBC96|nr:uncharacterized protein LOC119682309 [Teleopsis dalmanni]